MNLATGAVDWSVMVNEKALIEGVVKECDFAITQSDLVGVNQLQLTIWCRLGQRLRRCYRGSLDRREGLSLFHFRSMLRNISASLGPIHLWQALFCHFGMTILTKLALLLAVFVLLIVLQTLTLSIFDFSGFLITFSSLFVFCSSRLSSPV